MKAIGSSPDIGSGDRSQRATDDHQRRTESILGPIERDLKLFHQPPIELERRPTIPTANSRAYAAMAVVPAITAYAHERRAQVSPRMVAYWLENAKPLGEFFKATKLRQIIVAQLTEYQNASHRCRARA